MGKGEKMVGTSQLSGKKLYIDVLDLVSQVRDVVLMNVYLDLGNSGGSGF